MKALLLSAGLGTRLKPFTDFHPKALAKVNGKTLLERNISYLKNYGVNEIVINIHHFGQQIIDFLETNNNFGVAIEISDERDAVLETGGGIKKAGHFFSDTTHFLVMNSDILTNLNIRALETFHLNNKNDVTLAITDRMSRRSFVFNSDNQLVGWLNDDTLETITTRMSVTSFPKAFSGIQIMNTAMLNKMNQEGKFSIVDVYLEWSKTHQIKGYNHNESTWIDVGKKESIEKAEQLFF